jgi:hypothetical protein
VQKRVFSLILLAATTVSAALIRDVREAIDHNDFGCGYWVFYG